jgi:PilZ domain
MAQQKAAAPAEAARIDPRFPASAVPSITALRLSPGDSVDLVNISRSGILVEGRTRFVPGTRVTVIAEGTFTPTQMKGRVVRCQVSSINGGALRYQSGIQFDQRLDANPAETEPASQAAAPAATPPRPGQPAAQTQAVASRKVANRW